MIILTPYTAYECNKSIKCDVGEDEKNNINVFYYDQLLH